jgi:hypothetical protein
MKPWDYLTIPLLAFFAHGISTGCTCPLLRWITETKSECCVPAVLIPLTITSVTL